MHQIEYDYSKYRGILVFVKNHWKSKPFVICVPLIFVFLAGLFICMNRASYNWVHYLFAVMFLFLNQVMVISFGVWSTQSLSESERLLFANKCVLRFGKDGISMTGYIIARGKSYPLGQAWKTFVKWREKRKYFLLYVTSDDALLVPKRAFTQEQMTDFRSCLNAIPGKTACTI